MKAPTLGFNSNFFPIVISLAYSIFLCYSDLIFGYSFDAVKDRSNYQAYFGSGFFWLGGSSVSDFLFSEPFFLVLMAGLSILFDSAIDAVRALIALSSFVFSYSLLKINRVPLGVKILILFFPWVLVNYIMTLRQGVALSAFMYAYFHASKYTKVIIYSILPLTHYLFWVILAFLGIKFLIDRFRISAGVVGFSSFIFITFMLFGLLLSLYKSDLVAGGELYELLVDYRAKIGLQVGFGWVFWFIVLLIFGTQRISLIKENYFSFLFLLFYLIFSPFFPPVSRIMQVGAPFILVGALGKTGLTGFHRIFLILMLFLHVFYFIGLSVNSGGPGGMIG